jgi:hypothetical protein
MSIKGDIFRNNLKQSLGVQSLDQINAEHTQGIIDFMSMHHDRASVREAVTGLPNFIPNTKAVLEAMSSTFISIVKSTETEVLALKEIIVQLNNMLDKPNVSQKDRDKIFDLIDRFSAILTNQLEKNSELKKGLIDILGKIGAVAVIVGGAIITQALKRNSGGTT